jgi:hypothetical protein
MMGHLAKDMQALFFPPGMLNYCTATRNDLKYIYQNSESLPLPVCSMFPGLLTKVTFC